LQMGFDYEGFISSIRQGNGLYGTPINYYMPQFQKLTQEDLKSKCYKYDPSEARKLWQAAAPAIQTLRILISTGDPLVNEFSCVVGRTYRESLGMDTKVEAVDINTWAARAIDRSDKGAGKGTWDLLGY